MDGLNKKLSENIDRKIDQLGSASLKYLLSLAFLGALIKNVTGLGPVEDTLLILALIWLALSVDPRDRVFVYLFSIGSAAYLMNHITFLIGISFSVSLILSEKIFEFYGAERNLHLLIAAILVHIGDLATTTLGLQMNLSERNPFLLYLENFVDLSYGLIASKFILILLAIYIYDRDVEGLNSLLKMFFISGFILALSNLDTILSGM